MRKIDMYYNYDNDEITIICKEENDTHYQHYEVMYHLEDFKNWAQLYNKTLDDFDAEYDDALAEGLETLCRQFWKENELCDSVTQE